MDDIDVEAEEQGRRGTADGAEGARGRGARTTLLVGLAVVGAFVAGMVGITLLSGTSGPPSAEDGVLVEPPGLEDRVAPTAQQPLPEMTLDGFGDDAEPVDLAAYRGGPLVVNFWASWCAPCVREMPDFQRFSEEFAGRVPLLGVNVQDAPANARAFVEELGITYDLAVDPTGELYSAVGGFGMPTTLFVDRSGTIVYRHTGPLDADELRELVGEHLGEAA